MRPSVVIVGAGITGLAAAWELSGAEAGPGADGPRIELIEANDQVGGTLITTTFAGRTIDLGPDGFLARRPEVTALVDEIGWRDRLEAIDASGASIFLRGRLDEIPPGLALGVPTSSKSLRRVRGLTWRARLAARRDEVWPTRLAVRDDMSIGEILRMKLGRELTYQFIEPMVGGIQAGRVDDLSAKSVSPSLLDAARRGGSLMKALRPKEPAPATPVAPATPSFYTLRDGVGALPVEIARQLEARGVVLRRGTTVRALRRMTTGDYAWEVDTDTTTTPADAVILAVPAPVAGQLLGRFDSALESLSRVRSAGAAIVTFALAREHVSLIEHGTGVLVPLATAWSEGGTMMVTAITLLDRKWPHLRRDDDVILRAHVGRIDDERWQHMNDDELSARVAREVRLLLGRFDEPYDALVQRWPAGLPQYDVGHDELVERAKAASAALGVALCGNAYDGVGIPASIGSGRRGARAVRQLLADRHDARLR